jgi:hypothetical protein
MSVQNGHQVSQSRTEDAWSDYGSDFVLIAESKPPPRIELGRQRMLICRLYLGLMRTFARGPTPACPAYPGGNRGCQ